MKAIRKHRPNLQGQNSLIVLKAKLVVVTACPRRHPRWPKQAVLQA
jgi:hypothetical protein